MAADAINELRKQTEQWHDRIKAIEDQRHGCREQVLASEPKKLQPARLG